ncbi:hypothetical protein BBD42_09945 [Paenibacillus sp. BIHB 4019]|uniref:Uncharacterized protein n=1 Tax=Paenibacillus sp. BIHB 4019 TaxID=1870819 RepID=A0A1B2DGA4_9BACL|nr:hypothetical protein [Paenibacillus sp. BIHB 4019]ANY66748.1 hypothetical protein BBD42_09945 [Paenibacillus sp. BIHB 4019]
MSEQENDQIDEQQLIAYITSKTKASEADVKLVLKHEMTFINNAQENASGEVEVDSDELVDYILKQRDVKLDELTVETILDLEMEYLMDQGVAGYVD